MIVVKEVGGRKICMEWVWGLGLMNRYNPYHHIRLFIQDTPHSIAVVPTTKEETQDAVCKAVDKLVEVAKEMNKKEDELMELAGRCK